MDGIDKYKGRTLRWGLVLNLMASKFKDFIDFFYVYNSIKKKKFI